MVDRCGQKITIHIGFIALIKQLTKSIAVFKYYGIICGLKKLKSSTAPLYHSLLTLYGTTMLEIQCMWYGHHACKWYNIYIMCTPCTVYYGHTEFSHTPPKFMNTHTLNKKTSICMFNRLTVKTYVHWLGADVAYLWACCYETFIRSTHSKQMKDL